MNKKEKVKEIIIESRSDRSGCKKIRFIKTKRIGILDKRG